MLTQLKSIRGVRHKSQPSGDGRYLIWRESGNDSSSPSLEPVWIGDAERNQATQLGTSRQDVRFISDSLAYGFL